MWVPGAVGPHTPHNPCSLPDMANVLGRLRLSHDTDASTSVDRQRADVQAWADKRGHTVVGWAIDVDVSGSVRPFDTPEFGKWLNYRADEFDLVVAWTLSRISRNAYNTSEFFKWCEDNSKGAATTNDKMEIDTTSTYGKLIIAIMSIMAENELEEIKARTKASHAELRKRGRWHGGAPPYGYTTEKRTAGNETGWYLVPDPVEAPITREIFERASTGEPLHGIAEDLNRRGVATRKKSNWTRWTIRDMLKARNALGQSTHKGQVVVDETGLPFQRAEPIVPFDLWQLVQAVRAEKDSPKQRSNGTGLLLNVAFCADCGEPLYHNVNHVKGNEYRYWRCSGRTDKKNGCTATGVRAERVENETASAFLDYAGGIERTIRVFRPAEGYAEDIARIDEAITATRAEKDAGLYEGDLDSYLARLTKLTADKKALADKPNRPAGWGFVGTGETYSEAWDRMDTAERRQLLRDAGVRVTACLSATGSAEIAVHVDLQQTEQAVHGFDARSVLGAGLGDNF